MPWTRKASAPTSFSLSQSFAALVSGDTSLSWLANYIPLIPPAQYNTDAFCAAGPSPVVEFTFEDFSSNLSGFAGGLYATSASLGLKMGAVAKNRLFGAYCEGTSGGGSAWTEPECLTGAFAAGPRLGPHIAKPEGATKVRLTVTHAVGTSYFGIYRADDTSFDSTFNTEGHTGPPDLVHEWELDSSVAYCFVDCEGTIIEYCIQWYGPIPAIPYDPIDQPMPPGLVLPEAGDYPDIAALGAELDRLELKLEYVLSIVGLQEQNDALPINEAGPPVEIDPESPVDITDAAGVVITMTTIPTDGSEQFGDPPLYWRLGNVFFWHPHGWGPIEAIRTSPQVIAPMPLGRTSMLIRLVPGAAGTVRIIPRPVPLTAAP